MIEYIYYKFYSVIFNIMVFFAAVLENSFIFLLGKYL